MWFCLMSVDHGQANGAEPLRGARIPRPDTDVPMPPRSSVSMLIAQDSPLNVRSQGATLASLLQLLHPLLLALGSFGQSVASRTHGTHCRPNMMQHGPRTISTWILCGQATLSRTAGPPRHLSTAVVNQGRQAVVGPSRSPASHTALDATAAPGVVGQLPTAEPKVGGAFCPPWPRTSPFRATSSLPFLSKCSCWRWCAVLRVRFRGR